MTKKWIVAQQKCREPILTQPITNLDYGHSKRCENEYCRRCFFVEPGGDELVPLTHAARTPEAKKLQRSLTQEALGHGSDHLQPTGPALQTADGCYHPVAQAMLVPPMDELFGIDAQARQEGLNQTIVTFCVWKSKPLLESVIGYAEAYRNGERISTAHVECTVNQLINWRMYKKQQMGWSRTGAQYLLHVKTATINGRLERYTGHHSVPEDIAA